MNAPPPVPDEELARLERLRARFGRIASRLRRCELQELEPSHALLSPEDLDPRRWNEPTWFLGFYSKKGIERALEAYGITAALARRGWTNLQVELDLHDPTEHRLRIRGDGHGRRRALLAELVARLGRLRMPPLEPLREGESEQGMLVRAVIIAWLTLQSPGESFRPDRPRLPGQRWPGLGIGAEVIELLYRMGLRLQAEALIAFPAYYHAAVLYRVRFSFVDPADEGRLRAYCRDLADLSLAEASWAFELGCVRERDSGAVVHWQGHELCMPLVGHVAERFADPRYEARAREVAERTHVVVDRAELRRRMVQEQERFAAAPGDA